MFKITKELSMQIQNSTNQALNAFKQNSASKVDRFKRASCSQNREILLKR